MNSRLSLSQFARSLSATGSPGSGASFAVVVLLPFDQQVIDARLACSGASALQLQLLSKSSLVLLSPASGERETMQLVVWWIYSLREVAGHIATAAAASRI